MSNAFLQKYNVSTIEEIFEQKLPLRIGNRPEVVTVVLQTEN